MRVLQTKMAMGMLGAAALVLGGAIAARAQAPASSVWGGVFTAEQAERGKIAYAEQCAACHGAGAAGIDVAPALAGSGFLNNWNNTTAGDLFTRIKDTMPLSAPGSLPGREVADIQAYLFQINGFPAGQVALPPNAQMMAAIKIQAQKPAE